MMSTPKPFQINVPPAKIKKLKQKLSLADFPDELDESGWDMGCPLSEIKRLTRAWETWDWKGVEETWNEQPQFTTEIEVDDFGKLNIHFLHQKSGVKNAIPFVHGCTSTT